MSEEQTERLGGENNFQARVLAEFAALNDRLTNLEGRIDTLEEKVDARLRETRPIWEAVLSRLDLIESKMYVPGHDMLTRRGEVELLKRRVQHAV